jgi:uncharacterized cupin superfamily protein
MSEMRRLGPCFLAVCVIAMSSTAAADEHPAYITKKEVAGEIFKRPTAKAESDGKGTAQDVVTFTSKDRKFLTGMYKAGPEHEEYKSGYENNEFIYVIDGSIKLTSVDGTVVVVGPGEAATIPKGWKGKWDSDGYLKIWTTYDPAAK